MSRCCARAFRFQILTPIPIHQPCKHDKLLCTAVGLGYATTCRLHGVVSVVNMQMFRGLTKALATLQTRPSPVSQLPELTRWHAESVLEALSRMSALRSTQLRSYASMPLSTEKERLVILGTGWAAARLTKDINCNYHDITVALMSFKPEQLHTRSRPFILELAVMWFCG